MSSVSQEIGVAAFWRRHHHVPSIWSHGQKMASSIRSEPLVLLVS